ncbi:hypothetical protein MLD38_020334 [Melastoma candidum]|uniref:Uncharacterized protein n=1 Tax=Melastoma candidum TaxID=119954 RepID=A0ACB9QCS2_9MYRT|nr:hypothetical protein MLD38_020334 [Melastoma candidum]
MKSSVVRLLLLVGLLLLLLSMVLSGSSSSSASARPVPRDVNGIGEELVAISSTGTDEMIASRDGEADDWSEGTGEMEEANGEEGEWMKKRVMAEEEAAAHLDYIYTQRHSKP